MPLYFFHVDNGEFVPDPIGTELADLEAAKLEAVRAGCEMIGDASEAFWELQTPWNMHVTDADRRLLFTLQFGVKVPSGEARFIPKDDTEPAP